jgi:hypothetical protein
MATIVSGEKRRARNDEREENEGQENHGADSLLCQLFAAEAEDEKKCITITRTQCRQFYG